jgi:ankyrin repeat protein
LKGADLFWLARDGNTLLHLAVALDAVEVAGFLIDEVGINPMQPNGNGETAVDLLK